MKLKERVMRRLAGLETDITPTGCTTAYAAMELMRLGRCERPLADTDPQTMAALSLAGHKQAGFDWIKAMGWDITCISEALGCTLGTPKIDTPYFIASHPFAERSVDELECPADFLQKGRFPLFKKQFRLLREQVGDDMAIFGMSEGVFTCAGNLLGTAPLLRATLKDATTVEKALGVTEEALIKTINFAFSNGADYFCVADPSSGSELLSPRAWLRFVAPVYKRIVKAVQGPLVLHICGNVDILLEAMCDTGVAGISLEEKSDLGKALEIAHARGVKVFGNVSSSSTLFMGSPEACYAEAIKALEQGVDFLAPGCGIAPASPMENILQLRRARDKFFKQPRMESEA